MPQATILSEQDFEQFQRDGYYIARGLFSADEIDAIRETFMQQAANGPVEGLSHTPQSFSPNDPLSKYPRMMHPHRHADKPVGPVAMRAMLDPRVREVLTELMAEEPIAAQSMFYFKPPGARGQDLHQDNFYLRVHPGTCMAAWIAVDDADEENGGMLVVPQTSNLEIACPERADNTKFFTTEHVEPPPGLEPLPLRLQAGDVLFFNGSVIHGSYSNTSKDRFRRALICHYLPTSASEISDWYKPLYRFDGTVVEKNVAQGGGPCGNEGEPAGPH